MEGPMNNPAPETKKQEITNLEEDTYDEVCRHLEFVKEEIGRLESSENKEQLDSYKSAVAKLEEKRKFMEEEWEKSQPFRLAANKVFGFSSPKPGAEWGSIQTEEWMNIGKTLNEVREEKNTEKIKENLNMWAELLKQTDKKESETVKALKSVTVKNIQIFLEKIEEYENKGEPMLWDQVRDKI